MNQRISEMSDTELMLETDRIVRELQETEPIAPADYDTIPDDCCNKIDLAERIVSGWDRYIYSTGNASIIERRLRRNASYYLTLVRR